MRPLPDRQEITLPNLIRFEALNPTPDFGEKAIRVRQTFGISHARYARLLVHILRQPATLAEALALDAPTVRRLERARDRAAAERAERRLS